MFNRAERSHMLRREAKQLFHSSGRIHRLTIQFDIWKFPKMRVHHARGSLLNQKPSVMLHHKSRKSSRRRSWPFVQVRKIIYAIFLESETVLRNRANQTFWLARRANQCAKFH